MNSILSKSLILASFIALLMTSCDQNRVFQEFADFEEGYWHQDSVMSFKFKIEDSSKPYNLKAEFRSSQSYPFHNMYYQYTLKDGRDSVLSEELMQLFLFDPKSGEPYGSGVGDLFDHSQPVLENYTFPASGDYKAELRQYMRLDTLPYILSVGWRVETVEE